MGQYVQGTYDTKSVGHFSQKWHDIQYASSKSFQLSVKKGALNFSQFPCKQRKHSTSQVTLFEEYLHIIPVRTYAVDYFQQVFEVACRTLFIILLYSQYITPFQPPKVHSILIIHKFSITKQQKQQEEQNRKSEVGAAEHN